MNLIQLTKTKIFADGAKIEEMREMDKNPLIAGFTTNPTLMKKAGITDYKGFAQEALAAFPHKPISLEVFSDDWDEMEAQARKIASWGQNVFVKIPITNTRGESSFDLLKRLSGAGIKTNVTAILSIDQVRATLPAVSHAPAAYISVFAGRIADTGIDPLPIMQEAVNLLRPYPQLELIWASPREALNVAQADQIGCHIITITADILNKMALFGKDLSEFSLETVKMFFHDAQKAGYQI